MRQVNESGHAAPSNGRPENTPTNQSFAGAASPAKHRKVRRSLSQIRAIAFGQPVEDAWKGDIQSFYKRDAVEYLVKQPNKRSDGGVCNG